MKKVALCFLLIFSLIVGYGNSVNSQEPGELQAQVNISEDIEAKSSIIIVYSEELEKNQIYQTEKINEVVNLFEGLTPGSWEIEVWLKDTQDINHIVKNESLDILADTTKEFEFSLTEKIFKDIINEYNKLENKLTLDDENRFLDIEGFTIEMDEQWEIAHVEDNYYNIIDINSGKAISFDEDFQENGANIFEFVYRSGENQRFKFEDIEIAGVGIRPIPFNQAMAEDWRIPWIGNYEDDMDYDGFVARNIDVTFGPVELFPTDRKFFEYYVDLSSDTVWVETNPEDSDLIGGIKFEESQGATVDHILISREGWLHGDGLEGPIEGDPRILYKEDVDDLRQLFQDAYDQGIINHNDYKLIQMIDVMQMDGQCGIAPFLEDTHAQQIVSTMDGIVIEVHQFFHHWPFEEHNLDHYNQLVEWTIEEHDMDFIFYYGPIKDTGHDDYYERAERDWLYRFWEAGLPKYNSQMFYYLNIFQSPEMERTIGPESDPDTYLGFTKWLIEELKDRKTYSFSPDYEQEQDKKQDEQPIEEKTKAEELTVLHTSIDFDRDEEVLVSLSSLRDIYDLEIDLFYSSAQIEDGSWQEHKRESEKKIIDFVEGRKEQEFIFEIDKNKVLEEGVASQRLKKKIIIKVDKEIIEKKEKMVIH